MNSISKSFGNAAYGYDKNADIHYVKKWFNEYQIGLDTILNNSFQGNPIELVLNTHYNDMEKFSPEKDKAYNALPDCCKYDRINIK